MINYAHQNLGGLIIMEDTIFQLIQFFGAVLILFAFTALVFVIDFAVYVFTGFSVMCWIDRKLFDRRWY